MAEKSDVASPAGAETVLQDPGSSGSAPIQVDIGAAMQMLQASPELAQKMNELVGGPMLAEALAEVQRLGEVGEALYTAIKNLLNGIDTGLVRLETDADETLANVMCDIRAALAKAEGR